jgi:hypothetical protein
MFFAAKDGPNNPHCVSYIPQGSWYLLLVHEYDLCTLSCLCACNKKV